MSKKDKITFLFGAGASAAALPVVKKIPERMDKLIAFLENGNNALAETDFDKENDKVEPAIAKKVGNRLECQLEMIKALKWLRMKLANHLSVDTLAKKMYLNDEKGELKKLKITLSVLFTFEHAFNPPDPRYDGFYASMLDSNKQFPVHVKLLTWNYDYQFEQAYIEYSSEKRISENLMSIHGNNQQQYSNSKNNIGIFKINGSIGFNHPTEKSPQFFYNLGYRDLVDPGFINKVVLQFARTKVEPYEPLLSFAWESDESFINRIIEQTKDSKVLVVIGYSFPFFNREIDRRIIGSMESLEKVYFQAPDAETLKERFQAIRDDLNPNNLVCKFDKEQFFLPNEL